VVDIADAQSGEHPSDPMEPLRRCSDLADARKPLSTGRGRLHHSSVKVAVWPSSSSMVGSRTRAGSSASVRMFFALRVRTLVRSTPSSEQCDRPASRAPPVPVGIDVDGRERLEFIDGEVPVAPYPDWSQTDTALASIARLLRGLHDAARGFDPQGLSWEDSLADPAGGTLVCHNDVEPSNVVFCDGIAVALLDFEFAAPGRPVYDLAQLARLCVPIDDDFDQARLGWRPADRPARLRLVADAYGLDRDGRAELLPAMNDAIDRLEAAVRRSVAAGNPVSVELWSRTGGSERYDRRRRWWMDHHDQFAAALL
jgi:hypothetical protein